MTQGRLSAEEVEGPGGETLEGPMAGGEADMSDRGRAGSAKEAGQGSEGRGGSLRMGQVPDKKEAEVTEQE